MMGYFANGAEGAIYEAHYCERCIHFGPEEGPGCPIMLAHLVHNYDECNKEDSILHMLIPRSADGLTNEQCLLFVPDTDRSGE
jgi:hypothetical protein